MAQYRVVTGPKVTTSGRCCGPDLNMSGDPFAVIINQQAQEGFDLVQIFEHQIEGAVCCIIPQRVAVNLLVFRKT